MIKMQMSDLNETAPANLGCRRRALSSSEGTSVVGRVLQSTGSQPGGQDPIWEINLSFTPSGLIFIEKII